MVNRRLFSAEVFSKERMELEGMRILGGVRTDFAENRKISLGQGLLGINN